jgi:predicted TIM-barrel fold metal-dependent hydrolase/precorrin-6B methylase 2
MNRRQFVSSALAAAAAPLTRAQQKGRAKIDAHVHLGRDRRDMERVTAENADAAVKYLVGEMDRRNVEKSLIVSVAPLFPTEAYLAAAKLAPERLMVACSVMVRPIDQAIEKMKAYHQQGAKALKLQPMQYDPHDPAVERLVYEAVKLGMPVLFHHMDTPKSFPDMLTHFASTFADGDFVVVHFGGVYGFHDVLPLARMPNVYLETSTAFSRIVNSPEKSALHFLAAENRLNRLIFGSELPSDYDSVFAAIDQLLGPNPKEDVARAIYKGNADRILKISISAKLRKEEEDRERNEKVSEIFELMGVKAGDKVAEIGAGPGFFPVRLSRLVGPSGRVYAEDISESAVKRLQQRIREDELDNVEVIRGETADPKLPRGALDAVLIVNAYHEITEYKVMLDKIRESLKPGGRLVIMDMIERAPERRKVERKKLTDSHEIAPEIVDAELRAAGYTVSDRRDPFIDRAGDSRVHWLLVAR